jgi:hypothetical protein
MASIPVKVMVSTASPITPLLLIGVGVVATHSHNHGAGLIAIGGAITTPTAILGLGTAGEAIDGVGRWIGIWGDASEGGTAAKVGIFGTAGAFASGTPTGQIGVLGQYSYEGVQGQAWRLAGLGNIIPHPPDIQV